MPARRRVAVHGRTAAQSYTGESDWTLIARVAESVKIPVFGSGDCTEPDQIVRRLEGSGVRGVLVGRGALRNPWIFAQAAALARGQAAIAVPREARGDFLLEYIDLLLQERCEEAPGFRHSASGQPDAGPPATARGRQRWVINKLRALGLLVHEGNGWGFAPPRRDQLGRVDRRAEGTHYGVFSREDSTTRRLVLFFDQEFRHIAAEAVDGLDLHHHRRPAILPEQPAKFPMLWMIEVINQGTGVLEIKDGRE